MIYAASLNVVVKKIRGEEGSVAKVKVYRKSVSDYIEFDVKRRVVENYSVSNEMLEDNIGYIQIEQSEQTWQTHMFGGALVPFSKTDDYSNPSTSYNFGGGSQATNLARVSFSSSITIKDKETKDFAVCVVQPYTDASFDLTAQMYDNKPGTIVASAVKSGLSKTNFKGPGHTYVWSIDITGFPATSALNINPLGNNELAF